MAKHEIVSGQKSAWQIQEKVGEGDAGEIFLVASMASSLTAYLKRPVMSAFRGDIFRQSSQIRNEARVITALNHPADFGENLRIGVPRLLDQSKPGPEYNEGNFIILEKAEGLNLGLLARVARKGLDGREELTLTQSEPGRIFLREIADSGSIPEILVVDILTRLAFFLDIIHHLKSSESGKPTEGIIWNDVKPEHLFWDPGSQRLTVIDWGNARFLEADQTIVNHQFTWMDDFRQFFDEMGKYLSENAPVLVDELGWKDFSGLKTIPPHSIEEIKNRLSAYHRKLSQPAESDAGTARRRKNLAGELQISAGDIKMIQNQIKDFGAGEDFQPEGGADYWMGYLAGFAGTLSREERLDDLARLCRWAAALPNTNPDYWEAIGILVEAAGADGGGRQTEWLEIVQGAAAMEWEDVLWKTAALFREGDFPEWWQEFVLRSRRLALGEELAAVRPLEGLWRVYYTLQSLLIGQTGGREEDGEMDPGYARGLMKQISDEMIPNWSLPEPTPPDSRLDYRPVMQVITEAVVLLPAKDQEMLEVFSTPSAKAEEVLGLWEKRDFPGAAALLRQLLVCDPDRLRVLPAERNIRECSPWLEAVQNGPAPADRFIDWVQEVEFRAARLRSQVGQASWLESILDGCRLLQEGRWPADLLADRPDLAQEMPWLASFDRPENTPGKEKSGWVEHADAAVVHGVEEGRLGLDEAMALVGPLDAWAPEARGSSARVLSGLLQMDGGAYNAAVKLMRMDQVHYALPLFREEAVILSRLADAAGVAKMVECGFIHLDEQSEFPLDTGYGQPPAQGDILRIGPGEVDEFLGRMDEKITAGWTPYLAVEKQEQEDNLLYACDAGVTRGRYQPVVKLLKMAVQICDILETAHARGIVYRDHKILHYYWNDPAHSLTVIDWNVARFHPEGPAPSDIEMDIVQFGARGLHHILTGRAAPGALPLGPTRPEEIEAAAHTYKTHWTYDDARLPKELKEVMEKVLAGGYTSIPELREDLKKTLIAGNTANSNLAEE